ncbi:MAG: archaeosortase/exosortase family protein [Verrucomicrobiales bacterium]
MIFLEQMIALPLRYTTAPVSAGVLNLIGVSTGYGGPGPIYSSADLAAGLAQGDRFKLDVAEACSGLRSSSRSP